DTIRDLKYALEHHPMKRELFGILDDLVLHETNEDFKKALSELQEDNIDSRFYVSEWRNCTDATGRSNMNYNNLQPGDLLEFKRENRKHPFRHWAVYIGPVTEVGPNRTEVADPANLNHVLVHMHGPDDPQFQLMNFNQSGHPISFGILAKEIENSARWRINNKLNARYKPNTRTCVVFTAIAAVSRIVILKGFKKYDAYHANCEHFAKFCGQWQKESRQTRPDQVLLTLVKGGRNNFRRS
ncbi:hypothetical protein QYM36_013883, partial [Artemia franciscana]